MSSSLSPDASATGLTDIVPDPLRYGSADADPCEAIGILRSFIPSGARVLDVGCGTAGSTLAMTVRKTDKVVCLEPDPLRAQAARDRGFEVHCAALDDEALAYGLFDAIIFGDVLEHLPNPARAVALARDCLAPEGALLISVPNVAHWTIRAKLVLGRFDYENSGLMDATHLRWFTRKTLLALLGRQGLVVTDYRVSAGTWIPAYKRKLLRMLPVGTRSNIVRGLARNFPTLFGAQHVVRAVAAH